MNTPAEYFTEMYRGSDDPWSLAGRWYEERKYALTVASLPRCRYRSAFEPACSAGVLTALLAERCDRLLSCDRSERAVGAARRRLTDHPHVQAERRLLPQEWPAGPERFDLVVLSEMLYYFAPADVGTLLRHAVASLEPGGTLVAVHWRHPVPEHAQPGDAVHRAVRDQRGLVRIAGHEEPDFLLDVFVRPPRDGQEQRDARSRSGGRNAVGGAQARALSVAAAEGLV